MSMYQPHRPSPLAIVPVLLVLSLALAGPALGESEIFLHEATASNSFLHVTQMDHPSINGDPDAKILVSHVANPRADSTLVTNDAVVGISYSPGSGRWSIENQDLSLMPEGARFFVLTDTTNIRHDNTAANTSGSTTTMQTERLDGKPYGVLTATYVRTRTGASGGFNDHPIALEYDAGAARWTVINQDGGTMPSSGGFVLRGFALESALSKLEVPGFATYRHTSSASSVSGSLSRIDLPGALGLNGAPHSFVWVTLHADGVLDPRPVGLTYDFVQDRWAIYHTDGSSFPIGAEYEVHYVHFLFWDDFESNDLDVWAASVP